MRDSEPVEEDDCLVCTISPWTIVGCLRTQQVKWHSDTRLSEIDNAKSRFGPESSSLIELCVNTICIS